LQKEKNCEEEGEEEEEVREGEARLLHERRRGKKRGYW